MLLSSTIIAAGSILFTVTIFYNSRIMNILWLEYVNRFAEIWNYLRKIRKNIPKELLFSKTLKNGYQLCKFTISQSYQDVFRRC